MCIFSYWLLKCSLWHFIIDNGLLLLDLTTLIHVMVMFRIESTPIEFVADVNEDGFSFVHEH
jgi:hypothetical protein